jgi:hypothetical protein
MVKSSSPTCPVLDSSSFAPVPMLPPKTCLYSASSILAVCISCHAITVLVFRKPLFINKLHCIYVCYRNIMLYKYSIRYCPQFHITTVGPGTYYLRIQEHTCIRKWNVHRPNLCHASFELLPLLLHCTSVVHSFIHPSFIYIPFRKCVCVVSTLALCMGKPLGPVLGLETSYPDQVIHLVY